MRRFPLFVLLAAFSLLFGQQKIIDRIIAVIDDQIILESELNEMVYFTFQSIGKAVPVGSMEFIAMREKVLGSMIEDKLLLKEAEAESIFVSKEEINRQRDGQIDAYVRQIGSMAALEEELKRSYGLTLIRFRKQLEDQIREQGMKMQLAQKIRQKLVVTKEDVAAFLRMHGDSLPKEKGSLLLAHVQKNIVASQSIIKVAHDKIKKAEGLILDGRPFADVAKEYSDDPSAAKGGDIGFFEKGFLDPAFEKAAFSLNVGEVSSIVRSSYGFHIIKLEERKDNSVRARHILAFVLPSAGDTLLASQICDSVGKFAVTDSLFRAAASLLTDDRLTKEKGGVLGWLAIDKLDGEYKTAISSLGKGENSPPVIIGNSYHVFRLIDKVDERTLTLEDDYEIIRSFAINDRLREELANRAERIRKKVFVENRLSSR